MLCTQKNFLENYPKFEMSESDLSWIWPTPQVVLIFDYDYIEILLWVKVMGTGFLIAYIHST